MLASNPSRNSRPELIVDDGQGAFLPARPIAWAGPDGLDAKTMGDLIIRQGRLYSSVEVREAVPWPEFTGCNNTSDR
jgi:hypothetical protein